MIRKLTLIAVLVCGLALVSGPPRAEAQGRKIRKTENYFSPQGGVADATVREINKAEKLIEVAMYSISVGEDAPIYVALREAAARGVKIVMVLNKARTGSSNKKKSLNLESIGVDVRYVTRTMHEKFAVIDRAVLVNGSANFSTSADQRYSENAQVIASPKYLVTAFRREFRHLVSVSKDFDPAEFEE